MALSIPILFISLGLFFLSETFFLAFSKFFTIDEFQYAHAAWLCSQGMVPFRDFFDHHFPFFYQLFSLFFYFGGNDPLLILWLRGGMLFLLFLLLSGIFFINGKFSKNYLTPILTVVFLLSCWPLVTRVIEIRPDGIAFALFILSLAMLYADNDNLYIPPVRKFLRSFFSGIFFVLALWASQKVAVYGFPVLLWVIYETGRNLFYEKNRKPLFSVPSNCFILGFISFSFVILIYLFATSSINEFWAFCILFPMEMQKNFRGFSWIRYFYPGFCWYLWAIPLFIFGFYRTFEAFRSNRNTKELVILFLPFFAFLSYYLQKAPYDYSLIPFYGVYWLFAGRGGGQLFDAIATLPKLKGIKENSITVLLSLSLAIAVMSNIRTFEKFREDNNHYQLSVLHTIKQVTSEEDVFFDNTGNFVSRKHAYFYYFNCKYMRENMQDKFADEIPRAIMDQECVWLFNDYRMNELPQKVKRFIVNNFVRYSADLWVWGREFKDGNNKIEFHAVKEGNYFVCPALVPGEIQMEINGKAIDSNVFKLKKGINQIRFPSLDNFYIIYLPADLKEFKPKKTGQSTFVR